MTQSTTRAIMIAITEGLIHKSTIRLRLYRSLHAGFKFSKALVQSGYS